MWSAGGGGRCILPAVEKCPNPGAQLTCKGRRVDIQAPAPSGAGAEFRQFAADAPVSALLCTAKPLISPPADPISPARSSTSARSPRCPREYFLHLPEYTLDVSRPCASPNFPRRSPGKIPSAWKPPQYLPRPATVAGEVEISRNIKTRRSGRLQPYPLEGFAGGSAVRSRLLEFLDDFLHEVERPSRICPCSHASFRPPCDHGETLSRCARVGDRSRHSWPKFVRTRCF